MSEPIQAADVSYSIVRLPDDRARMSVHAHDRLLTGSIGGSLRDAATAMARHALGVGTDDPNAVPIRSAAIRASSALCDIFEFQAVGRPIGPLSHGWLMEAIQRGLLGGRTITRGDELPNQRMYAANLHGQESRALRSDSLPGSHTFNSYGSEFEVIQSILADAIGDERAASQLAPAVLRKAREEVRNSPVATGIAQTDLIAAAQMLDVRTPERVKAKWGRAFVMSPVNPGSQLLLEVPTREPREIGRLIEDADLRVVAETILATETGLDQGEFRDGYAALVVGDLTLKVRPRVAGAALDVSGAFVAAYIESMDSIIPARPARETRMPPIQ